jgi:hypothetical protein
VNFLPRVTTVNPFCSTEILRLLNAHLEFKPEEQCLMCCYVITMLGCRQICVLQRPTHILCGQCCHIHPGVLSWHHHIIICLVLWEKSCGGTITAITRHCRTLCVSGCREGTATFTRQEYTPVFKSGKRLSKKMEATSTNYAISNVVVKFCEISHVQLVIKNRRHSLLIATCSLLQN